MLAAVLAAVTIPAHALGLRLPWTQRPPGPAAAGPRPDRHVLASRPFLLLVTAATLCAFAQYAALVNLVPLLTGRGLSPALAAWALGLGGAGQVAGRLCYRALASRLGARGRTVAVIAAGAMVTLLLGLLPGPAALLIAAAVLAGGIRGVFTLTEATLVADYWGSRRYAVVNGVFNAPLTAAGAVAPSAGAAIAAATGSYPALFAILAVLPWQEPGSPLRPRSRAGRTVSLAGQEAADSRGASRPTQAASSARLPSSSWSAALTMDRTAGPRPARLGWA